MDVLDNSDRFSVMLLQTAALDSASVRDDLPALQREGFEIVDKRHGREVFLEGSWARLFEESLQRWREKAPSQDEIETTLEGYAQLAHTPVVLH